MAKFCKHCNIPYKKFAYKCVICGTVLEKKRKTPMQIALIAISITLSACLLIASCAYLIYDYNTSPETRVKEIMQYLKDGDFDAVMDSLPSFIWQYEQTDEAQIQFDISFFVDRMNSYIYSFNTNNEITPSERQIEELIDSIKKIVGDEFDASVITDVKVVWVDVRGGVRNFWQTTHERFVMIKYQDEWCWWPYY